MKNIFGMVISLVILFLGLSGCGFGTWRGGYGGHMMDFGYGGGLMGLLILIAVIVLIYFLFRSSRLRGSDFFIPETPLEILKKRYAKGEITKEEFDKMKEDIED